MVSIVVGTVIGGILVIIVMIVKIFTGNVSVVLFSYINYVSRHTSPLDTCLEVGIYAPM